MKSFGNRIVSLEALLKAQSQHGLASGMVGPDSTESTQFSPPEISLPLKHVKAKYKSRKPDKFVKNRSTLGIHERNPGEEARRGIWER